MPGVAAADRESVNSKHDREDYYELLMVFADTIDQIDRNYVEKVSRRELVEAAIEGALKKLDPYSNYIAPQEIDSFRVEVENEFAGVGIQIFRERDQLRVVSPIVGAPAYKAGIVAGDLILSIDGKTTKGLSLDDSVKLMKGLPGTDVVLTVFHPLNRETEDITLTREIVKVDTVLGDLRNDDATWQYMYDQEDKIGYVRISTFGRETANDLRTTIKSLKGDGLRALILDLRFNPGGLLKSAIEVSDLFLSNGRIVATQGRNIQPQSWDATARNTYAEVPMVVLVNQFSASASEIVAAALQDHERAIVIGQQTYGKASVQNVVELEGGKSALKITTGSYERPSGKPIHRFPEATEWGVRPNDGFEVQLTDRELHRLIRQRRASDRAIGDREPSSNYDPQIRRALAYVRSLN